jgi:hypothetical protein
LVLNTIKILQKGSKECDKFSETRWGIQMMEGGRDKVNVLAASGMSFLIRTSGRTGGGGRIFRK